MPHGVRSAGGWVVEAVALTVCAALVATHLATIHSGEALAALALLTVGMAGAAVALAARAGRGPAGIATLVAVLLISGATAADDPRTAVLAFAASALVPLVALLGDRRWRPPGGLVALLALATLATMTACLVLRDPFRELRCEPFCGANPFLLSRSPGAVRLGEVALVAATLVIVTSGIVAVVRRRTHLSAATLIRLGVSALWAVTVLLQPRPVPDERVSVLAWSALVGGALALASVDATGSARVLVIRRRIAAVARSLASAGDEAALQRLLRTATRDPDLTVTVGEDEPAPAGDLTNTTVVRSGRAVATVTHRPGSRGAVEDAVTPAVALAMETRLLRLEASRQVAAVQASRVRAVEAANAARRRLERDLHDGAQQQLLVAGMLLAAAADQRTDEVGLRWRAVAADVATALIDVRRLGRGDAATIAELGLADAVTALAAAAPVAVSVAVRRCPAERHECWPDPSATVAYRLVAGTIADADRGRASAARIEVSCLGPGNGFVVEAGHDGTNATDRTVDRDRVVAIGGRTEPTANPGAVRAWFP